MITMQLPGGRSLQMLLSVAASSVTYTWDSSYVAIFFLLLLGRKKKKKKTIFFPTLITMAPAL